MLRNATTRLIATHLVLVTLSTIGVLGYLYWSTTDLIDSELRQVVTAELRGLAENYEQHGVIGLGKAVERRLGDAARRDAVYLLTDPFGQPITGNLAAWPPTVEPGAGWVELELYRTDRERSVLIAAASVLLPGGERLLVGRDAEVRAKFDRTLLHALARAFLAAAVLSLITGWLLSRLVLSRIAAISATAADIVSGDLGQRIPLRGTGDEFDRLGTTLNRMLDRIETLVANLRTVTDSLAHDLRHPLSRLKSRLSELEKPELSEAERQEAVGRARAEAEAMLQMLTALVEISRAEAGLAREDFEPVDLAVLAADAAELYGPVAEEKGLAIRVEGESVSINGHRQFLIRALSNLIENALRYAPEGSEITIRTDGTDGAPRLTVADRGPGIPAADRERVLERFVTLDASRSDGGGGLGLALVAAVAKLHDAEVRLEDTAPGLAVSLILPGSGAAPPAR